MTAIKTKTSFSYCLDRGVRVTGSKIWLITGSSRGLGRALAESVLAAGEKLIATARDISQLDDLPRRFGDAVRLVPLDVTDQGAAINAVDAAVSGFGGLDVLVNNAGYGDVSSIEDTSLADFRSQIETNLFGVINLTKAAIPTLRQQRSGHIIQVSSISGRIGPAGRGAYAASKSRLSSPAASAPTSPVPPPLFVKGGRNTMPRSARPFDSSATTTASNPEILRRLPPLSSALPATNNRRSDCCWEATRLRLQPRMISPEESRTRNGESCPSLQIFSSN